MHLKKRYIFQGYKTHIKHIKVPMVRRGMGLRIRNDRKNKVTGEEPCLSQMKII